MNRTLVTLLAVLLCLFPVLGVNVSARAANAAEDAQGSSEAGTAGSASNTVQPGVVRDSEKKQRVNEYWSEEMESSLALACNWLTISKQGELFYLCMGTAGEPAPAQLVTKYISDISLREDYETILEVEYAALNATFCGYSAENVLGKNLIRQIAEYPDFEDENLYAVAYALLALDSNRYALEDTTLNSREGLLTLLCSYQNTDGGFSARPGQRSSPTQTALALMALADYRDSNTQCHTAIQDGLEYLSQVQREDGTFSEGGQTSATATAKVITALITLNVPLEDERFVKSGKMLPQTLMEYVSADGGFRENADGNSDVTATENAILALSALKQEKNPYALMFRLESQAAESEGSVSSEGAAVSLGNPWTVPLLLVVAGAMIGIGLMVARRAGLGKPKG